MALVPANHGFNTSPRRFEPERPGFVKPLLELVPKPKLNANGLTVAQQITADRIVYVMVQLAEEFQAPTDTPGLKGWYRLRALEERLRWYREYYAKQELLSKVDTSEKRMKLFAKARINRAIQQLKIFHKELNAEELIGSVECGAPVNYMFDSTGETVLTTLILWGSSQWISNLVNLGVDVRLQNYNGWSPLCLAVYQNDTESALTLIQAGAPVNELQVIDFDSRENASPLMIACAKGFLNMISLLLAKGALPQQRNAKGRTPLMFTTRFRQSEAMKRILDEQVEIDTVDNSGFTATDWLYSAARERILNSFNNNIPHAFASKAEISKFSTLMKEENINELSKTDLFRNTTNVVEVSAASMDDVLEAQSGKIRLGVVEFEMLKHLQIKSKLREKSSTNVLKNSVRSMLGAATNTNRAVATKIALESLQNVDKMNDEGGRKGRRRASVVEEAKNALKQMGGASALHSMIQKSSLPPSAMTTGSNSQQVTTRNEIENSESDIIGLTTGIDSDEDEMDADESFGVESSETLKSSSSESVPLKSESGTFEHPLVIPSLVDFPSDPYLTVHPSAESLERYKAFRTASLESGMSSSSAIAAGAPGAPLSSLTLADKLRRLGTVAAIEKESEQQRESLENRVKEASGGELNWRKLVYTDSHAERRNNIANAASSADSLERQPSTVDGGAQKVLVLSKERNVLSVVPDPDEAINSANQIGGDNYSLLPSNMINHPQTTSNKNLVLFDAANSLQIRPRPVEIPSSVIGALYGGDDSEDEGLTEAELAQKIQQTQREFSFALRHHVRSTRSDQKLDRETSVLRKIQSNLLRAPASTTSILLNGKDDIRRKMRDPSNIHFAFGGPAVTSTAKNSSNVNDPLSLNGIDVHSAAAFRERLCGVCVKRAAAVRCLNCSKQMCEDCAAAVHSQQGLAHHRVRPILRDEDMERGGVGGLVIKVDRPRTRLQEALYQKNKFAELRKTKAARVKPTAVAVDTKATVIEEIDSFDEKKSDVVDVVSSVPLESAHSSEIKVLEGEEAEGKYIDKSLEVERDFSKEDSVADSAFSGITETESETVGESTSNAPVEESVEESVESNISNTEPIPNIPLPPTYVPYRGPRTIKEGPPAAILAKLMSRFPSAARTLAAANGVAVSKAMEEHLYKMKYPNASLKSEVPSGMMSLNPIDGLVTGSEAKMRQLMFAAPPADIAATPTPIETVTSQASHVDSEVDSNSSNVTRPKIQPLSSFFLRPASPKASQGDKENSLASAPFVGLDTIGYLREGSSLAIAETDTAFPLDTDDDQSKRSNAEISADAVDASTASVQGDNVSVHMSTDSLVTSLLSGSPISSVTPTSPSLLTSVGGNKEGGIEEAEQELQSALAKAKNHGVKGERRRSVAVLQVEAAEAAAMQMGTFQAIRQRRDKAAMDAAAVGIPINDSGAHSDAGNLMAGSVALRQATRAKRASIVALEHLNQTQTPTSAKKVDEFEQMNLEISTKEVNLNAQDGGDVHFFAVEARTKLGFHSTPVDDKSSLDIDGSSSSVALGSGDSSNSNSETVVKSAEVIDAEPTPVLSDAFSSEQSTRRQLKARERRASVAQVAAMQNIRAEEETLAELTNEFTWNNIMSKLQNEGADASDASINEGGSASALAATRASTGTTLTPEELAKLPPTQARAALRRASVTGVAAQVNRRGSAVGEGVSAVTATSIQMRRRSSVVLASQALEQATASSGSGFVSVDLSQLMARGSGGDAAEDEPNMLHARRSARGSVVNIARASMVAAEAQMGLMDPAVSGRRGSLVGGAAGPVGSGRSGRRSSVARARFQVEDDGLGGFNRFQGDVELMASADDAARRANKHILDTRNESLKEDISKLYHNPPELLLADRYTDSGKLIFAEPLYIQTLEMQREKLGEHMEFAIPTMIKLAKLYVKLQNFSAAEKLLQEARGCFNAANPAIPVQDDLSVSIELFAAELAESQTSSFSTNSKSSGAEVSPSERKAYDMLLAFYARLRPHTTASAAVPFGSERSFARLASQDLVLAAAAADAATTRVAEQLDRIGPRLAQEALERRDERLDLLRQARLRQLQPLLRRASVTADLTGAFVRRRGSVLLGETLHSGPSSSGANGSSDGAEKVRLYNGTTELEAPSRVIDELGVKVTVAVDLSGPKSRDIRPEVLEQLKERSQHHEAEVLVAVSRAELDLILTETQWVQMLRSFVQGRDRVLAIQIDFLLAVLAFKAITDDTQIARVARTIATRFLNNAASIPGLSVTDRSDILDAVGSDPDQHVFDTAVAVVRESIFQHAMAHFLASPPGQRYTEERSLIVGLPKWTLPQVSQLCKDPKRSKIVFLQCFLRFFLHKLRKRRVAELHEYGYVMPLHQTTMGIVRSARGEHTSSSSFFAKMKGFRFKTGAEPAPENDKHAETDAGKASKGMRKRASVGRIRRLHSTESTSAVEEVVSPDNREGQGEGLNEEDYAFDEETGMYRHLASGMLFDSGTGFFLGPGGELVDSEGNIVFSWEKIEQEMMAVHGPGATSAEYVSKNAVNKVRRKRATPTADLLQLLNKPYGRSLDGGAHAVLRIWDPNTNAFLENNAAEARVKYYKEKAQRLGWTQSDIRWWAALVIQRVFRGHRVRTAVGLFANQYWAPKRDSKTGYYYYVNVMTGESRWKLPAYFPPRFVTFKVLCASCQVAVATKHCVDCVSSMCSHCFSNFHKRGKRSTHKFCNITFDDPDGTKKNGNIWEVSPECCAQCEVKLGSEGCQECKTYYCKECSHQVHSLQRGSHKVTSIYLPTHLADGTELPRDPAQTKAKLKVRTIE